MYNLYIYIYIYIHTERERERERKRERERSTYILKATDILVNYGMVLCRACNYLFVSHIRLMCSSANISCHWFVGGFQINPNGVLALSTLCPGFSKTFPSSLPVHICMYGCIYIYREREPVLWGHV